MLILPNLVARQYFPLYSNIPLLRFLWLCVPFFDFTIAPLDLGRGGTLSSRESESESKAMCILASSVIKYNTVLALIQVPPIVIIEIKVTLF